MCEISMVFPRQFPQESHRIPRRLLKSKAKDTFWPLAGAQASIAVNDVLFGYYKIKERHRNTTTTWFQITIVVLYI